MRLELRQYITLSKLFILKDPMASYDFAHSDTDPAPGGLGPAYDKHAKFCNSSCNVHRIALFCLIHV